MTDFIQDENGNDLKVGNRVECCGDLGTVTCVYDSADMEGHSPQILVKFDGQDTIDRFYATSTAIDWDSYGCPFVCDELTVVEVPAVI
jgi:hypothetical protein